ncbi:thioredoxin family protein [Tabrizicola sp.]|uniref:thioredoxin family protein n=1 Tax=Tabrizicola sp. TaxID=2005166 RepID=UPI003F30C085
MKKLVGFIAGLLLSLIASTVWAEPHTTEFNDQAFDWYPYEEGFERAKAAGKPIFVLVKADWCPQCQAYQKAFLDPRVTAYADRFVFVILDIDREMAIASTIAPDGDYIPRTMIFTPSGMLQQQLAPYAEGQFRYFLDPAPDVLAAYLDWVVAQPGIMQ